jgi:hypothetical protein
MFFHSTGLDMLQLETTAFSLGHPIGQILHHADFFFEGLLKTAFMYHHCSCPSRNFCDRITHALQAITVDMLHQVWDEFDYRVDVCCVTQGAHIEGL